MRGESLEPGGCSDPPTSGRAALTIACPTDLAGRPATAPVAAAEPLPSVAPVVALSSWSEKLVVAGEGAATGAAVAVGASICCSSATRAMTRSRDMQDLLRPRAL